MKTLKNKSARIVPGSNGRLIEFPPTIRTLKFGNYKESHGPVYQTTLSLALPYVVFRITGDHYVGMRMGFCNKPVERDGRITTRKLQFPLLPSVEIEENYKVCMNGYIFSRNNMSNLDIVGLFWQMPFNMYGSMTHHRWPATTLLADTPLRSYKHWAELTKKHGSPDFMLDFDYIYKNIAGRFQCRF